MVPFLTEISLNGSIFIYCQLYFYKIQLIVLIWNKKTTGIQGIAKCFPVGKSISFFFLEPDNYTKLVTLIEDWYYYTNYKLLEPVLLSS